MRVRTCKCRGVWTYILASPDDGGFALGFERRIWSVPREFLMRTDNTIAGRLFCSSKTAWAGTLFWALTVKRAGITEHSGWGLFWAMRYSLLLAVLVTLLFAYTRWIERGRGNRFEWSFFSLLWLNLFLYMPGLSNAVPAFHPLIKMLLPSLAFMYMVSYLVPLKWRSFLVSLPESPRFGLLLFLVLFAVYGLFALRITATKGIHAGDEIHYILQTRSLVHDHDLDLTNQIEYLEFTRESFSKYHISQASRSGEAHSHHPFGISLLMAPGYALMGTWGALFILVALSSLLGPVLYRILSRETSSPGMSAATAIFFSLSLPVIVYAVRPYPELAAGICYLAAYYIVVYQKPLLLRHMLAAGFVLGFTSWLLTRRFMIPMALINVAAVIRLMREQSIKSYFYFLAPQILLLLGIMGINAWRFAGNEIFTDTVQSAVTGGATGAWTVFQRAVSRGLEVFAPDRMAGVLYDKRFGVVWINFLLAILIPASVITFIRFARTQWAAHGMFWTSYLLINGLAIWAWPAGICHQPRYILAVIPFLALPFASLLAGYPALIHSGGIRIGVMLAVLSLAGIWLNPFRFDSTYVAYTELHPSLGHLASALPWHRSFRFYDGPLNAVHILATAAAFAFLSLTSFHPKAARISMTSFFLLLLAVMIVLNLFFA